MEFLSIKIRFVIEGLVYAFVVDTDGIEIVWLSGNVERPDVIQTIYSGRNVRAAARAIRSLQAV
jgi:hypothetical protein